MITDYMLIITINVTLFDEQWIETLFSPEGIIIRLEQEQFEIVLVQ